MPTTNIYIYIYIYIFFLKSFYINATLKESQKSLLLIKGIVYPKIIFYLTLTLMSFQTCTSFFLM